MPTNKKLTPSPSPSTGTDSAAPIKLDLQAAKASMTKADAVRFEEALRRYQDRPKPPIAKLENKGGRKWATSYGGDDQAELVARVRVYDAFGTCSQQFVDVAMGEMMTIWDANGGVTEKAYNAALAILESARPQNELEAMLVMQMIAANEAAMVATAMVGKSQVFPHAVGFGNLANKFMRTFTAQSEALAKLRRGGEQIVKYVHVHEGGQAVVAGTINQTGGRQIGKIDGQPHATRTLQECPSLPGPDQAGIGVPIAGDAKRQVQAARR
jgi:hypothetical protein